MSDLAEFLLARIAEDEEAVRGISSGSGDPDFYWGPDRVRGECAARRRIVELHRAIDIYPRWPEGDCAECSDSGASGAVDGHFSVEHPCPTLRLLALPHAEHPDYLDEWRP
jgi:uncharacterized protein DUF6221